MILNDLTILCILFKPSHLPAIPYLFPIQSGAATSDWQSEYSRDNTGPNISVKNATHSELTALYWAWKNGIGLESRFVGVCHYRRFFMTSKPLLSRTGFYKYKKVDAKLEKKLVDLPAKTEKLLAEYDLITTKPFSARISKKEKTSLKKQYAHYHHAEDWEALRLVIKDHQPEYLQSFEEYEAQGYFYQFNMFIGKKEFFHHYMEWVFSLLGPLDELIPEREGVYQKRAVAFISERLLGLYIHHNRLNTVWLPVSFIE